MRASTLVWRSLVHYRRTNAAVFVGVAVACAVLVGALSVGDSVRHSLRQITLSRLGEVDLALVSQERFFRAQLAGEISGDLSVDAAALILADGVVSAPNAQTRANRVQVAGVDESFWSVGGRFPVVNLADGQAAVNRQLAERLRIAVGDAIVVRVQPFSALPVEAPFSVGAASGAAMRLRVVAVLSTDDFGDFSLRANQVPPMTVFVPRELLAGHMGVGGLANTLLLGDALRTPVDKDAAAESLKQHFQARDAGFTVRALQDDGLGGAGSGRLELSSRRIFIEEVVVDAATEAVPAAREILAYFVNEIRSGELRTPYSVVAAPGEPVIPGRMRDDEIIVNEWLAADLDLRMGDFVDLSYYALSETGRLVERSSRFQVRRIIPMIEEAADRTLMPNFPGIAEAETAREWTGGIPIDLSRIRKKDEDYWYRNRGTPKAFVTLAAAVRMWGNRFGSATAVRFGDQRLRASQLEADIAARLRPEELGLFFREVKAEGLRAAATGVDFGQLFLGLSFFLVVAALLLTGVLFVFAVEGRSQETGVLLAVGFTPGGVRRLLLAEGALVAGAGAVLGALLGALFNMAVLAGLSTVWRRAVLTTTLQASFKPSTILTGAGAGAAMAVVSMWLACRKQAGRTIRDLSRQTIAEESYPSRRVRLRTGAALASLLAAAVIVVTVGPASGHRAAGAFFAAGALCLVGGLLVSSAVLHKLAAHGREQRASLAAMGLRSATRSHGRSLATIAILACGVFIVIAVGANRQDPAAEPWRRSSGTGGFALYAETALPLTVDLTDAAELRMRGLDGPAWEGVSIVSMRLGEGDDASCLNLNRTARPRILAVDPKELASREAFTFTKTAFDPGAESPWMLLDRDMGEGTVAAIADENVIVWGLGKSVGDTLSYVDERGARLNVKLVAATANSILQGAVVISESSFLDAFPSAGGARVFLVDAQEGSLDEVAAGLSRAFADFGMDAGAASRRLALFNSVQNTYLAIFLALGGLGLVLASGGLAVVVGRNVLERRGEFAVLRAVGFSRAALVTLILWEHCPLLVAGVAVGALSAAVAVLPAVLSPGGEVPFLSMAFWVAAVCGGGVLWTYIAARISLKGELLSALRNE